MESIKAVVSKPGSKSPSKTISNPNEISWGERLKHQSWDLVNGCSQRSKRRRCLLQDLKLKPHGSNKYMDVALKFSDSLNY